MPSLTYHHLKSELDRVMRERNYTAADLTRALGWQRETVDRLFRPNHRSNLEKFEAAFAALGYNLRITVSNLEK